MEESKPYPLSVHAWAYDFNLDGFLAGMKFTVAKKLKKK